MSFMGALGQGLLGAVSGGAGAYVDETKRQVKLEDEAAKEERMMRLRDEIAAARAERVLEQQRKMKESDREAKAGRMKGYADKAGGMLSKPEFEFDMNNPGELTPDAIAAAGAPKMTPPDDYSRYTKAAEMAAMDGYDEESKTLAGRAGLSPTAAALEKAKLAKAEFDASGKSKAQIAVAGPDGMFAVRDEDGNVQYVKNPDAPSVSYHYSDGEDGGGGTSSKPKKLTPAMLKENAAIEAARMRVEQKNKQGKNADEKDVELAKKAKYGNDGKLEEFSRGVLPSWAGNKQTVAPTSGNMPKAKVVSMAEVLNAVNGDKAKAAKLAEAIRAKGGVVK